MSRSPVFLVALALTLFGCADGDESSDTLLRSDAGADASKGDADDAASDGGFNVDASQPDATIEPATDVEVVITSDNAYSFGWGDANKINTFNFRTPSSTAGEIFNCGEGPEEYVIPAAEAPVSAYLYVIAWSDRSVTQGTIGQFRRKGGASVFTGTEKWEVCATGDGTYVAPANGPAKDVVNGEIAKCNAGSGAKDLTSGGWVNSVGPVTAGAVGKLAIGEDNSTPRTSVTPENPFPIACSDLQCTPDVSAATGCKMGISTSARWMWYAAPGDLSPFISSGGNTSREFLIFRLPTSALPPVK
jgi:hypothetical protein